MLGYPYKRSMTLEKYAYGQKVALINDIENIYQGKQANDFFT